MAQQSISLPLQVNVSTADPNEKVKEFSKIANYRDNALLSQQGPPSDFDHTINNGIHAESGVTNTYLDYCNNIVYNHSYITEDGKQIGIAAAGTDPLSGANINGVYLDGKFLDNIPSHGLEYLSSIDGQYDDAILCDGGIICLKLTKNYGGSSPILAGRFDYFTYPYSSVTSSVPFSINNFGYGGSVGIVRQPLGSGFGIGSNLWLIAPNGAFSYAFLNPINGANNSMAVIGGINTIESKNAWAASPTVLGASALGSAAYFCFQGNKFSLPGPPAVVAAGYWDGANWNATTHSWAVFQSKNGYGRVIFSGETPNDLLGICGCVTFTSTITTAPTANSVSAGTKYFSASGYCYNNYILNSYAGAYCSSYQNIDTTGTLAQCHGLFSNNGGQVPVRGFGRISWANTADYGSKIPFEFRVMMAPIYSASTESLSSTSGGSLIGMQPIGISVGTSYSIANVSYDSVPLGVPITNIGEIDYSFSPQIGNGWDICIWRYNGVYFVAKISESPSNIIQKISSNLYKINTISPINVIDTQSSTLNMGSNDYTGGGILDGNHATGAIGCMIYSKFSNSIDYGLSVTPIDSVDSFIPGGMLQPSCHINNVYWNVTAYSISSGSQSGNLIVGSNAYFHYSEGLLQSAYGSINANPTYLRNPVIPVPLGSIWSGRHTGSTASAKNPYFKETYLTSGYTNGGAVLSADYDGYILGNVIPVSADIFNLFSTNYIYDGKNISVANFTSNALTLPLEKVLGADGLQFLTASPTTAYFVSRFDNSLFTFDGGRNLVKVRKFNLLPAITNGEFNSRDNLLLLDADTKLISVRDGLITVNTKTTELAVHSLSLYSTENGMYLGNDYGLWQYGYDPNQMSMPTGLTGTTTVQPLDFQTAYYGLGANNLSRDYTYNVAIYSAAKVKTSIKVTIYAFNQDEQKGFVFQNPQTSIVNINPGDYDDGGYFRFSYAPKFAKTLASSLRVQGNDKITVTEIMVIYDDTPMKAIYAPSRRAT